LSSIDPAFAGAAELGRRFRAREISPLEVARVQLERIERFDPRLRAYITRTPERALADAGAAARRFTDGGEPGVLAGVSLGLKDLIDTAGIRTTSGSRLFADQVPARDAAVAERCRQGGLVLTGKHNLHELAYGTTSNNPHYGACRNPWNPEHVAGGSSGGSAVALAMGLCTVAIGTDTGGSIRIPASACGIVGLKPTLGRVSRRGVWPLAWSLDTVGPMTRNVEDAALLLGVIGGHDPEDPWSVEGARAECLARLEEGARGLRIGVARESFFEDLEPDVEAAVEAAIAQLVGLGAAVREVRLPRLDHAYTAFHALLASEASALHQAWLRERPADYSEPMRQALELGHFLSAVDYVDARRQQQRVRADFAAAFESIDVLVAPTLPRTALALGEATSREPRQAWNRLLVPFNLAGLPAISIPCGFDRRGLPIGLQIAGRAWDEATVLRAARAYERATEWHLRRPAEAALATTPGASPHE
jgi:aspartyl-tRNA(Asn)/glutamyl-tRNA(Gln) amidotransferase subunit A